MTGINYLNGGAQVIGDVQVTGETRLNTNAHNDVAIVDSAGIDTMRINDAGQITLQKAGVVFSSSILGNAGLYLNAISGVPIASFQANSVVNFYGSVTVDYLTASTGLLAKAGTNMLNVGNTNTTITGPTVVAGSLNCGALTGSSLWSSMPRTQRSPDLQ